MNKLYCVYIIINSINSKVYIGKTSADTTRRWRDHTNSAVIENDDKQLIHRAMVKHGVENFSFDVLEYFCTSDEAYDAEVVYIKNYGSYGGGYNATPGGRGCGGINRKLSDDLAIGLIYEYVESDINAYDLGQKYNLSKPCTLGILHRRSYIDLDLDDDVSYLVWLKLHRCFYDEQDYMVKRSANSSFRKYSSDDVINIFNDFATKNFTFTAIAEKYDMSIGNIEFILNRQTNKNIEINEDILCKVNKIISEYKDKVKSTTKAERLELKQSIFDDFYSGISKKDIVDKYNLHIGIVNRVLSGRSWQNVYIDQTNKPYLLFVKKTIDIEIKNIINDYCLKNLSIKELIIKYDHERIYITRILRKIIFAEVDTSDVDEVRIKKVNEDIGVSKVESEDIPKIYKHHLDGLNNTQIGILFNIGRKAVADIINGKSYKDVSRI